MVCFLGNDICTVVTYFPGKVFIRYLESTPVFENLFVLDFIPYPVHV